MSLDLAPPSLAAVMPSAEAVLDLLGAPTRVTPSEPVRALVAAALAELSRVGTPRAVVEELDPVVALTVLADGGGTSLAALLVDRSPAVAAFVATLGAGPETRVAELFASGDPAAAVALDAAASAAADLLAERLASVWWEALGSGDRGRRPLPFSPGYCGWPVSGQRALFARLEADAIGVKLTPSCLMLPLKSVSGLLLAPPVGEVGPRAGLVCCAGCNERHCEGRGR